MLESYSRNPTFMKLVKRMVKETLETDEGKTGKSAGRAQKNSQTLTKEIAQTNPTSEFNTRGEQSAATPKQQLGRHKPINQVKSPSDTTLYAPGLNWSNVPGNPLIQPSSDNARQGNTDIVDQISQFIDEVRLENRRREMDCQPSSSRDSNNSTGNERQPPKEDKAAQARQHAERRILEAERFKATIAPAQGKQPIELLTVENSHKERDSDNRPMGEILI